jgi:putative PIN family toxin of toxin-antitoxin system
MRLSAVVDASVLVSAFLFPESVPGRIVKSAGRGDFLMHLSPILLEETRRSLLNPRLTRSYGHDQEAVGAWCSSLQMASEMIEAELPEIEPTCRDPNDDHVIAAAIVAEARWIVTGDKDLLAVSRFHNLRIVTARGFLQVLALD